MTDLCVQVVHLCSEATDFHLYKEPLYNSKKNEIPMSDVDFSPQFYLLSCFTLRRSPRDKKNSAIN